MYITLDSLLSIGTIIRPVTMAALLYGLWLGLRRLDFDRRSGIRIWSSIAIPLLLWLAIDTYLAQTGAFRAQPGKPALAILLAIIVPLVVGLVLLTRSKRIAAVIDAIPPSWLVGVQVFRVFGTVLIGHWLMGNLPGEFALPAGLGDVLVGVLALPVAAYAASDAVRSRTAAFAWNLLGIVDLVDAIILGVLTGPGRFHVLALDHPNMLGGMYPVVMIPTFSVPLFLILHGLSLWQLHRIARSRRDLDIQPHRPLSAAA